MKSDSHGFHKRGFTCHVRSRQESDIVMTLHGVSIASGIGADRMATPFKNELILLAAVDNGNHKLALMGDLSNGPIDIKGVYVAQDAQQQFFFLKPEDVVVLDDHFARQPLSVLKQRNLLQTTVGKFQ